jgi:hypothetical protein
MTPLQDLYFCVACVGTKHDALPTVHTNNRGYHRDLRLRQYFQCHLDVPAAKVLLFVRIRFAHGIEQAASTEHLGSKLPAVRTGFYELLHQYRNGNVAVTRRRCSRSIPAGQQIVRCASNGVNGIPEAHANARPENQNDGLRFHRNENLTGMKKMRM